MIYLIKSAGYGKDNNYIDLLKIGYTEDTKKEGRFNAYKLHNPTCKILYELPELTEEDEKNIQYKFRKYLYIDYGREWFEYNDEIVNFFKNPDLNIYSVVNHIDHDPKNNNLSNLEWVTSAENNNKVSGKSTSIDINKLIQFIALNDSGEEVFRFNRKK